MKRYIITLVDTWPHESLHLYCSLWWPDGEEYSWTKGSYSNVVVFERKSDAERVIESMNTNGVFKIEKVLIKGIAVHPFNPRFKMKK
jgi:hypothetical protein